MPAGPASRPGRAAGFTLVEFLVAMTVLAIVSVTALPSFEDFRARQRLRSAADNLYTDLQYARSESVQRNAVVSVDFVTGAAWCYGIHLGAGGCDCATANSCNIKAVSGADYRGVQMSSADFVGSDTETAYQIDPRRGQSVDAANTPVTGAVLLANQNSQSVRADVNAIGRVRLCSPGGTVPGYPTCPE